LVAQVSKCLQRKGSNLVEPLLMKNLIAFEFTPKFLSFLSALHPNFSNFVSKRRHLGINFTYLFLQITTDQFAVFIDCFVLLKLES